MFEQTGLTGEISLSPPDGYSWRVLNARIDLITGTITGNRSAGVYHTFVNSQGMEELCNTNVVTTVSSKFRSAFGYQVPSSITPDIPNPVNGSGIGVGCYSDQDLIQVLFSLQSGDSVNFYCIIEELIL